MFSCYTLIGAQNIAGYGTCPGLGRSKIEAKIELLHETPIKVPSSPLNYLGICQKYQCSAFKRKIKLFFFTPKPLKFYIFWMQGCKKGNKDQLSQHLASPTPPIYRSTSRLWVNNSKPNFLPYSASYNLLFLVQHDSIPKHTIFHSSVFHVPLLHVNKHISWVLLPLPSNRGSQLMLAGIRISWKLLLKSQASHLK